MLSNKLVNLKVACVVPTYNGKKDFQRLVNSLNDQTQAFDLLVVDSSSIDGTTDLARNLKEDGEINFLKVIPSTEFNHGGTRQAIIDECNGYDVYVFLTQDAYLADSSALKKIIEPFIDPLVGAVCGRQLPHLDANLLAQHARLFNYPATKIVKSRSDIATLGIKTAFISNSFSAYSRKALELAGGFPKHVILSEDMYVAARIILLGFKVVYEGESCCYHSHNYTLSEEFKRYFDIGVFHAREPWIRNKFGGAGGEGLSYVKSELKFLGLKYLYLWPIALLRNFCKLFAYKLGQYEAKLSNSTKKVLGMHKSYWSDSSK